MSDAGRVRPRSSSLSGAPTSSKAEQQADSSARLAGTRTQVTQADFVALESQVKALRAEGRESRQLIGELQADNKLLRATIEEFNQQLASATGRLRQLSDDSQKSTEQRFGAAQLEAQAAARELATLQTKVALLASAQQNASSVSSEHATQLKDVAVLRTQQTFLQQSVERSEQAGLETGRLMTQLRAELAGLQQRHAALASASTVEHAAHRTQHGEARMAIEDCSTRLQALESRMGACDGLVGASTENGEKLKRAAKRHELLLQRLSEVQESRAGELRGQIKSLVEQLVPLQSSSRQHGAQIEELSSGITVLADLVRFNNRSRTTGVGDALRAGGLGNAPQA